MLVFVVGCKEKPETFKGDIRDWPTEGGTWWWSILRIPKSVPALNSVIIILLAADSAFAELRADHFTQP